VGTFLLDFSGREALSRTLVGGTMTSPAISSAQPKALPFASPLPPPPANEEKKNGSAPSIVANPLFRKLQSSGRTPSHPLTANPPKSAAKEEVVIAKVSAADAKRAEKLLNDGILLAKKNKLEQAFKIFQKAYQLDPNNEQIARSVAKVLNLGGQPLKGIMICSEFLRRFPNSLIIRGMRAAIGESLLPQMQAMLSAAPKDQKPQIAQAAQEIFWVTMTDQALLAKAQAPQMRTALKAL
jgi:tetratricopeptide (TPR) repeat protein